MLYSWVYVKLPAICYGNRLIADARRPPPPPEPQNKKRQQQQQQQQQQTPKKFIPIKDRSIVSIEVSTTRRKWPAKTSKKKIGTIFYSKWNSKTSFRGLRRFGPDLGDATKKDQKKIREKIVKCNLKIKEKNIWKLFSLRPFPSCSVILPGFT